MDLFVPFELVRQQALLALYRVTYASNMQEYFSASEILATSEISVGTVFFSRALRQLVSESLVEISDWDDGSSYTLTNSGWTAAERLIGKKLSDDEPVNGVPASDRVVELSDNQRLEISDAIGCLSTEVESSNKAAIELGDSKERIQAELNASRKLFDSKSIRLGAIVALLATPLRFLAEKFGGEAIGELAKKLLDLLWNMINS